MDSAKPPASSALLRYLLPCWIAGVAASFALPFIPPWPLWAGAFVLSAAAALKRPAWLLLPVFLIGAGYGVWRTEAALAAQWPLQRAAQTALTVEVADMPHSDGKRVQFTARAQDERGQAFTLQLSDYQLRDWPVGSRWRISAKVRPIIGEVNLRGFNREAWALANGIDGQDFSDGIALMRALSIGEQSALRSELWQAFRPLGLTHLVSISGLHVTMIALLFGYAARRLLYLLPRTPAKPRLWVLLTGLSGALVYAGMAGFGVPTQRSVLMLAAFAWAWWRARGQSLWSGWLQALAAVLLLDPLAVLAPGTWLSFGLVAALIWGGAGRLKNNARQATLRGQWAASVCSVVLLGYLFAALPLISPLANALAIPWFSWVLAPLALLASALPVAPLQWFAAMLGEYTLRLLLLLADIAPEWPVAAAPLPLLLAATAAALILLTPRGLGLRPWAWLVLAAFICYRPEKVEPGRLKIMVMDAGQGLSVWMQTANRSLLFDTATAASAGSAIIPSLHAAGVKRLDALVLSHHDTDHDGGFTAVAAAKKPAAIWAGQPEFYPHARPCSEQRWQWDGVWFEFLRPPAYTAREDNDQSCVLRVTANGEALLLTGDLGQKGERALLDYYGSRLYSHILVLGHHGSNSASSGAFLNTVAPLYAVASSGYANAYNHPTPAVRNRVSAHGITLLRTDRSGALLFELGSGNPYQGRLKTYKPYWQKKPFDKDDVP
ncbi:DNA internalization-related competence protein ComEC/Rec2 [Bergeriella denitrificans]|uniref:Competence protein ComA n=1 Tax=Bergeriella denitrificans TaxID=494 RepID=A0A378UH58_BERDE|nr:DNA internalization-related competence protein ComEC/Rec2 [Bergeriella denitrificans]STZ75841.1 competence protein ComA [Bergeriella denitrificans]